MKLALLMSALAIIGIYCISVSILSFKNKRLIDPLNSFFQSSLSRLTKKNAISTKVSDKHFRLLAIFYLLMGLYSLGIAIWVVVQNFT
jgi:hypothetical protein